MAKCVGGRWRWGAGVSKEDAAGLSEPQLLHHLRGSHEIPGHVEMVSAYTQQMLRLRLPLTGPPPCGGLGGSRARVVEAVGVPAPRSRTRGSAREISLASAGQPWHRPAWDRLAKAPRGATVTVCVNAIPRIGRSQNSQGRRPPHLSLLGASTRPGSQRQAMALPSQHSLPSPGPDPGSCLCSTSQDFLGRPLWALRPRL